MANLGEWSERLSIRSRLLVLLLPSLLVLAGLWTWRTYESVLRFADLAHDRALYDTARTVATQIRFEPDSFELDLSKDESEMLEMDPEDKVYFEVVTAQGRRLGGNHELPAPDHEASGNESGDFYDRVVAGESLRLVEYRIAKPGFEELIVRAAETRRKRDTLAREALLTMGPLVLAFAGGIALVVWWSVGRGFRPLSEVRDAIAARHHGDLSPLSFRGLPPELRAQIEVINGLMARLEQTLESERSFLADATHQLRTPITVLRTQTELAMRSNDLPALKAYVAQMDVASRRLTRLANQLLNLSRAEAGCGGANEVTRVDLTDVVEEVLANHEPLAHAKRQTLRWNAHSKQLWVSGSPMMLGEMLANLVDNAIRYTPAGGAIEVAADSDWDSIRVTVRDDGPGIAENERLHVLNRFYRGTTATAETGSGLGLAIVQEIARAHGGRLMLGAALADGSGLVTTVELPSPPA